MKRKIVMAMAAIAVMGAATYAAAATGIKGSKHDLSFAAPGANQTDQVCVFCHTPHNAVKPVPLWNRNNDLATAAGTFKLYTSSQTFNNKPSPARNGFTADSISLFCMSCHDGSALGGTMIGAEPAGMADGALIPNYGGSPTAATAITASNMKLGNGTDLTKSHPVNFVYDEVKDSGLHTAASINLPTRFPLFKAGGVSNNLECGSCHAVHGKENAVNTGNNYPDFLRSTMKGSALCLGCHKK